MNNTYASNEFKALGVPIKGMNRYFIGTSGVDVVTSVFHGGTNFLNNAWDDSPNKFEQLGRDAGEFAGALGGLAMSGAWAMQHVRSSVLKTNEGMFYNGSTYQKLAAGGWEHINSKSVFTEEQMATYMSKGAFKVNVRNGMEYKPGLKGALSRARGTYRPMSGFANLAWGLGLTVGVGVLSSMALGYAGKVLDESYSESKHFRKPYYDKRFFNTQEQDMSSYQQLGAAMDAYENRMVSVSRIYHSRG